MLKFVREHELSEQIVAASKEANTKIEIAVPFWGKGGMQALELQKWKSVEIICNLESGGCNPYAIEELLEAKCNVRSYHRLHAKIYIFNDTSIIGSSNVSTNGLAREPAETKGWIEANVFSDEVTLVQKARALFREIWRRKTTKHLKLGSTFLKEAKKKWDNRPLANLTPPTAKTLLAACREQPRLFKSVFLAVYTEDLDESGKQATAAFFEEKPKHLGKPLSHSNAWTYQFKMRPGIWIIDFDFRGKKRARIDGCAQVTGLTLDADVVVAIRGNVTLRDSNREYRLSAKEKQLLERNSRELFKLAGDGELLPLQDALDCIDRSHKKV